MLSVLDVAIGLSFVFLLFSLLTTALNEIVLSLFDQRAEFLRTGLDQLLGNHEKTLEAFVSHGLIDSFSREKDGKPAYLPPEAFVTALLDLVNPVVINDSTPTIVRTAKDVAAALNQDSHPFLKDNPKLKKALMVLFDEAGGDLDKFKKGLETWFDECMDRVSGWYKRRAQTVLFCLSLAGAFACNVDAIHLIEGLSSDPKLRDGVVAVATERVKLGVSGDAAALPGDLGAVTKQVKDTLTQLNSVSLPIGWSDAQWNYLFQDVGHSEKGGTSVDGGLGRGLNGSHIFSALAGWFLTAFAVSLGAPFWFETLTRFMNIRGNGLKPEEAQKARAADTAKTVENTKPKPSS